MKVQSRNERLFFIFVLIASALYVIRNALFNYVPEGDTIALINGASAALNCIKEGQLTGCHGAVHFPLSQYIPAITFLKLGFSMDKILRIFIAFNTFAFIAIYALFIKSNKNLALVITLTAIASPFLWQAQTSFNEAAAAFYIFLVPYCIITNKSKFWLFISIILAGITKEVAPPMIFLLSVGIFFPQFATDKKKFFKNVFLVGVATFIVMLMNIAFNIFRYNSFVNTDYLDASMQVPSSAQHLSFLAGLIVSPNGGIIFYWPMFVLFLLAILIYEIRAKVSFNKLFPLLMTSVVFSGLMVGFARWCDPFGWICWGSRLIFSWMPALLFIILSLYSETAERILEKLALKKIYFSFLSLIILLLGLPQLFSSLNPTRFGAWPWFGPNESCPRIAYIQEPDYYYKCFNLATWDYQETQFEFVAKGIHGFNQYLITAIFIAFILFLQHQIFKRYKKI